ncbi:MAG: NTP transferase domain-containing protein [candidate division WOR-3 bacterium]|jgi:glucose-1-phosphate thymidylyltransferase|nr:NTP transferase domain-containing protein [candidate division WOR-3 bacterium]MCR4423222.1 sugar phosphate nucleotidyltransferase [candidate division WOR-3 bacterium]MDH7518561.1 sugar phosphate nucleotidyltransferase [bacterium]
MKLAVIVPAAGEGQRLRPHTLRRPKVMLEVGGKPIIGHIFDRLMELHPERVCVVVPPHDQTIANYLRSNFSRDIRFVVQPQPRGLADAVLQARQEIEDMPVLIILGDTIVDTDFNRLINGDCIIGVKEVSDPRRFGVVLLENGLVKKVIEKPQEPVSNLAIVGVYFFADGRRMFEAVELLVRAGKMVKGEFQFTDALQSLADSGLAIKPLIIDNWLDCGTPAALLDTNRFLLEKTGGNNPHGCGQVQATFIIPPVWIAPDAFIERSVIGPFVSVSARARITGSVVSDALIYQGAVVEQAVVCSGIVGEEAQIQGKTGLINIGPGEHREVNLG